MGKKWKIVVERAYGTINDEPNRSRLRRSRCYSPLLVLRATLSRIVLYTFARDRCNHVSVAGNLTEEKQRLMPLIIAFPYINGRIRPRDWTEIWQSANVGSCYRSIPT